MWRRCVRHWKYVVQKTRHGFCPYGAYGLEGKPVSYQAKKHVTRNSTVAVADVADGGVGGESQRGGQEATPWGVMTEWRDEGEEESTWARGAGHPPGKGRADTKTPWCRKQGALREASVGRGEGESGER